MEGVIKMLFLCGMVFLLADVSNANVEFTNYPIAIGNYNYLVSAVTSAHAIHRITIDKNGSIFYRLFPENNVYIWKNRFTPPLKMQGIPGGKATDIIMNNEGNIIISTEAKGFFMYDHDTNSASLHIPTKLFYNWMGQLNNGSVVVCTYPKCTLDLILQNEITKLQGYNSVVSAFAFDGDKNLYYSTHGENTVTIVRKGSNQKILVTGLPAGVWTRQIAYDRFSKGIFVCRMDGLYYIKPPSTAATKIGNFTYAAGIGFDHTGDIYLGTESFLLKLNIRLTESRVIQFE